MEHFSSPCLSLPWLVNIKIILLTHTFTSLFHGTFFLVLTTTLNYMNNFYYLPFIFSSYLRTWKLLEGRNFVFSTCCIFNTQNTAWHTVGAHNSLLTPWVSDGKENSKLESPRSDIVMWISEELLVLTFNQSLRNMWPQRWGMLRMPWQIFDCSLQTCPVLYTRKGRCSCLPG